MLSTLSEILPGAQFTVFAGNPRVDSRRYKDYDLEILCTREYTNIWAMFKRTLWVMFCRFSGMTLEIPLERKLKLLETYNKVDIVLFPTRDLISFTYGFKPLFNVLCSIFVATALHKPVMLYAVQIGPFGKGPKTKIAAFLIRFVLNRVNLITIRDKISRENLRKLGISKSPIYVTADPAFLLQPIPSEKAKRLLVKEGLREEVRPLIGINISSLIYKFGFPNAKSLKDKRNQYIVTMSRIIDYLIEKLGGTVIFVSHTFNPREQDDRTIAREIFQQVASKDKLVLITQEKTPEELKGIIGQMDLFITSRHHPLVHSISMHVPTIALDYTFKMKELMKRIGQSAFVVDIKELDYDELRSKINAAYFAKERIKSDLIGKTKTLQASARQNADLLKDMIQNSRKSM